jgi:hypothetical protein
MTRALSKRRSGALPVTTKDAANAAVELALQRVGSMSDACSAETRARTTDEVDTKVHLPGGAGERPRRGRARATAPRT